MIRVLYPGLISIVLLIEARIGLCLYSSWRQSVVVAAGP
jgi:hypothetical protein